MTMKYMVVAIVLGVVLVLGGGVAFSNSSIETIQFTVNEKERVCESGSERTTCRYLVFTDNGVYENTDSFVQWKFNSSDIYNELKAGSTYQAKVNWYRVPFLSMYKNILEVKGIQ